MNASDGHRPTRRGTAPAPALVETGERASVFYDLEKRRPAGRGVVIALAFFATAAAAGTLFGLDVAHGKTDTPAIGVEGLVALVCTFYGGFYLSQVLSNAVLLVVRIDEAGVRIGARRWPWSGIREISATVAAGTYLLHFNTVDEPSARVIPVARPFGRAECRALLDALFPFLYRAHPHVKVGIVLPDPL